MAAHLCVPCCSLGLGFSGMTVADTADFMLQDKELVKHTIRATSPVCEQGKGGGESVFVLQELSLSYLCVVSMECLADAYLATVKIALPR